MEKGKYSYKRDKGKLPIELSGDWDNVPYQPDPECPVCRGCGFVHPVNFGKVDYLRLVPCYAPGCLHQSVVSHLKGEFITKRDAITKADMTFSSFHSVPGTEQAYRYAKQFAEGKSPFVFLLLYGGYGSGKSHLCHAIARTLLENQREVKLVAAADMLSDLKAAMSMNTTETLVRELKEVFVLIIDEWGLEYGSPWEQEKFDEILTARYANARPTVVATNLDISQLPPRLRSRFEDKVLARVAKNSAGDYRKTKR